MSSGTRIDGTRNDRGTGVSGASLVLPPASQPLLPTLPSRGELAGEGLGENVGGEHLSLPPSFSFSSISATTVRDRDLPGLETAPVTHGAHVSEIVANSNQLRQVLDTMRENPHEAERVRAFVETSRNGLTGLQLLQAHQLQLTSVVSAVNSGGFRSDSSSFVAEATELARLNHDLVSRLHG